MPASVIPSWLYLPGIAAPGGTYTLPEDEAHYVGRVCRAKPGECATATDGAGTVADLQVYKVARHVEVTVLGRRFVERPHEARVLCGTPEGSRADWLVEKLAELGIAQLVPLECARENWRGARLDRARKIAVAALRQSRNAWLLQVSEPATVPEAIAGLSGPAARWIGEAGAPNRWAPVEIPPASVAAIGPAPGFTREERDRFANDGFLPVRLAPVRLRTETAAIAWASGWAAQLDASGFQP